MIHNMEQAADAHRLLLAAVEPPLLPVVQLHQPVATTSYSAPECDGCDFSGYDGERPDWPCRTIQLINQHSHVGVAALS